MDMRYDNEAPDIEQPSEHAVGEDAVEQLPTILGNTRTKDIRAFVKERMNQSKRELGLGTEGRRATLTRKSTLAFGEATLTFKDVTFSVRSPKGEDHMIVAPASGHFASGTLVALMGPSGCGKTTLLDILADKKTAPYKGSVHFNGRPRDHLFQRMVAYVPQDDIMPAHMTVKELLVFQSTLKEDSFSNVDLTRKNRDDIANFRLEVLGLSSVADSFIGNEEVRGISGGQKRRLSLARGIASSAHIIFCDEPTSGLSATDAETSVQYMKHLAHKYGVTIVVSIHQPRVEVAELFDHLVLLTADPGRVVYNGPMQGTYAYLANVGYPVPAHANPTDHFMDHITPGRRTSNQDTFLEYFNAQCKPGIMEVVERELDSNTERTPLELLEFKRQALAEHGQMPLIRDSVYAKPFRCQLREVFKRQVTLNLRDKQGVASEFIAALAKAVVVGIAYLGIGSKQAYQQVAFFFMLCMTCSIDGLKQMPKLIADRTVMKTETSEALYSEWAYIISFTVVSGVQWFVSHTIFITILFCLTGLPWELFGITYLYSGLLSFTMDGLYLMVSSGAKNSANAIVLSMPFLMLFLLYNGFTTTRKSVPSFMVWAVDISPVAYAIEQLVIACQRHYGSEGGWDSIVDLFGFTDQPALALTVICGFMIVFRVLQVVFLKCFNNIER